MKDHQRMIHEVKYIRKCLQHIQHKMGWTDRNVLVYDDFSNLQDKIFKTSGIRLSVHTLERLFGKLKTHQNYNPQKETKKALALFLGYNSWNDFKEHNLITGENEEEAENTAQHTYPDVETSRTYTKYFLRKKVIIPLVLIILLISGYVSYNVYYQKRAVIPYEDVDVQLQASNPYGVRPHTVKFNFNLANLEAENISMDFGVGKLIQNISNDQKHLFKTLFKPGHCHCQAYG
jgi:hypothetical protein